MLHSFYPSSIAAARTIRILRLQNISLQLEKAALLFCSSIALDLSISFFRLTPHAGLDMFLTAKAFFNKCEEKSQVQLE
jgi:hypothetical protein